VALTREELEALLARLDPDRERAGELYEKIRHRLVRFFEWRECENAEELADKTIDRAARRFAEGVEPAGTDPYHYFRGIAKNVYLEECRQRDRLRRRRELELPLALALAELDPEEEDTRLGALRRCLAELRPNARDLLLRYHDREDRIRGRRLLADERGIPLNALRIRVFRLRRTVEDCLKRHLRA
jgi:DNA-directed RNA polymerase specialized sigma24 family protein